MLVAEGLHPFHDERVRDLYDLKIYLDISDEVKFAWKIQRDMKERGHSLESIKASIAARKHDFDAFIDPQKKYADVILQVLPLPDKTCMQALTAHRRGATRWTSSRTNDGGHLHALVLMTDLPKLDRSEWVQIMASSARSTFLLSIYQ